MKERLIMNLEMEVLNAVEAPDLSTAQAILAVAAAAYAGVGIGVGVGILVLTLT